MLLAAVLSFTGCETPWFSFDPSSAQIEAVGNLALTAAQIAAMYRNDGITRVALCVGVSRGYAGSCPGADVDARRDAYIFESIGFQRVITLIDEEATRENIIKAAVELNTGLSSNDLFCVKGSSHGGEWNGKQYFCAFDGPFNDFDIWSMYCTQVGGVRDYFGCDTCHSGSMYRQPYDYGTALKNAVRNVGRDGETFDGSLIYVGGCTDDSYSYGSVEGGVLSLCQIDCIPESDSWDKWLDLIQKRMPENQPPVITKVGGPDFGYKPLFY